jgi:hypothetical protein
MYPIAPNIIALPPPVTCRAFLFVYHALIVLSGIGMINEKKSCTSRWWCKRYDVGCNRLHWKDSNCFSRGKSGFPMLSENSRKVPATIFGSNRWWDAFFQQDNCPIHTSASTRRWLLDHQLHVTDSERPLFGSGMEWLRISSKSWSILYQKECQIL